MQDARIKAYRNQIARCRSKTDAQGNPVEMRLTFDQWWSIWESSGHWQDRGRSAGKYCMSRLNDLGHYEVGNVFIQLHSQNISQIDRSNFDWSKPARMRGKKHSLETLTQMSQVQRGSGNANARLTENQVVEIKRMLTLGLDRQDIADSFDVSKQAISAIATGRNWKHVSI